MLAGQNHPGVGADPAEVSLSLRLRPCRAALFGPAVQPRQAHALTAGELAKPSDDHNLSIGLWHHPANDLTCPFTRIET